MDVIIICHTEFGFVDNKEVIFDKKIISGAKDGVLNLIKLADKYGAKVTFAVCPEVAEYFPKNIKHEIGLHIHPGWREFQNKKFKYFIGDKYLKEHCKQSLNSVILPDFSYEEQSDMIKTGKDYLKEKFNIEPKIFVAGQWSLNNNTIRALVENGFSHECSAPAHSKSDNYEWSKLPRICMPYHPSENDYQTKGKLPILIVPISQVIRGGVVNPEGVITFGFPWLKACFLEYYKRNVPLFHICLHSPSMTDYYIISIMDNFLSLISKRGNINFKFASEIKEYPPQTFKTYILPYLLSINKDIVKSCFRRMFLFKNEKLN